MMTMGKTWPMALAAICGMTAAYGAPLPGAVGETLIQSMPPGFKVGSRSSRNGVNTQEMIPAGEGMDSWTKMVTTQVFVGKGDWQPAPFLAAFGQKVGSICPNMTHGHVTTALINGYVTGVVILQCPMNPATGKPENIVARAIQGRESFYLVQVASRFALGAGDRAFIETYLRSIIACDTRGTDHPCPDMTQQGPKPKADPKAEPPGMRTL